MSSFSKRMLFWVPRTLSILLIAFISMFALDVFAENLGFWKTLLALIIHLIPSLVLIAALAVAWRREWIGAVIYAAAGTLYVITVLPGGFLSTSIKLQRIAAIALPAFVVAALFLANWLKHNQLRTRM